MKLSELLEEVRNEDNYLSDDIEKDFEELDEGVRFFKASSRLDKLALRLEKKKNLPDAASMAAKVKKAAQAFSVVEQAYKEDKLTKAKARIKLNVIKKQYTDIMTMLRNKEVKDAIKVAGIVAIIGGIIAAFIFGSGMLKTAAVVGAQALPQMKEVPNNIIKKQAVTQNKALSSVFNRAAYAASGLKKGQPTKIFNRGAAAAAGL